MLTEIALKVFQTTQRQGIVPDVYFQSTIKRKLSLQSSAPGLSEKIHALFTEYFVRGLNLWKSEFRGLLHIEVMML